MAAWEPWAEASQAGPVQLCLASVVLIPSAKPGRLEGGQHPHPKTPFVSLKEFFDFFFFSSLGCGKLQLFGRSRRCVSKCQLRQDAQHASSCTYLFVGPFVPVHLHHPLTEDVKRVFLVLLPVGSQPLPFGGRTPKEQNGELATPTPSPGDQETGNGLSSQSGREYVGCTTMTAKERESAL